MGGATGPGDGRRLGDGACRLRYRFGATGTGAGAGWFSIAGRRSLERTCWHRQGARIPPRCWRAPLARASPLRRRLRRWPPSDQGGCRDGAALPASWLSVEVSVLLLFGAAIAATPATAAAAATVPCRRPSVPPTPQQRRCRLRPRLPRAAAWFAARQPALRCILFWRGSRGRAGLTRFAAWFWPLRPFLVTLAALAAVAAFFTALLRLRLFSASRSPALRLLGARPDDLLRVIALAIAALATTAAAFAARVAAAVAAFTTPVRLAGARAGAATSCASPRNHENSLEMMPFAGARMAATGTPAGWVCASTTGAAVGEIPLTAASWRCGWTSLPGPRAAYSLLGRFGGHLVARQGRLFGVQLVVTQTDDLVLRRLEI